MIIVGLINLKKSKTRNWTKLLKSLMISINPNDKGGYDNSGY